MCFYTVLSRPLPGPARRPGRRTRAPASPPTAAMRGQAARHRLSHAPRRVL